MFIKFCGFTRPDDIEAVRDLPVSAVGFVFYPGSRRYISPRKAIDLSRMLHLSGKEKIGVFVESPADEIIDICQCVNLDRIQLYDPSLFGILQGYLPLIRSYRIREAADLEKITEPGRDDLILLDAFRPDQYGGTGESFDWRYLKDFPYLDRTIIAGGINEGNLARLLRTVSPYGLDISSGIEEAPGKKSAALMRQILQLLNEVKDYETITGQ